MSEKAYCGIRKKPPTGHHKGTIEECVKLKQIRRYGIKEVSRKDVKKIQKDNKESKISKEEQERKIRLLVAAIKGKERRLRILTDSPLGHGKKADIDKEIKELQKEIPELKDRLKRLKRQ